MSAPKLSERDFVRLFSEIGPHALARRTKQSPRVVFQRRESLERKLKIKIHPPEHTNGPRYQRPEQFPHRAYVELNDGIVLIGSDAHIWPGPKTTAMRGFIKFAKELKPKVVILNGDVMDFSQISKHDPLGWEKQPTVKEEIEAAQDILHEISVAAGRARKIWTLGNHDARFEKRLAIVASEYAELQGMHLKDAFPLWEPCWSVWVNGHTTIKHRWKGGENAPFQNTLRSGVNIVTAHLHSAKVIPYTDYNGTRYGVDDGCLCDPTGRQFLYTEDAPLNWRAGFSVLTFYKGKLLMPELALVLDSSHIQFRGNVISV